MHKIDHKQAYAFLRRFFSAMNAWERRCEEFMPGIESGKLDYESVKQELIAEFNALADIYFAPTASRLRVRKNTYFYQMPPEYDPELERIVSHVPSKDSLLINTVCSHGFCESHQYTIVAIGSQDDLRIQKKLQLLPDGSTIKAIL
ncbi:hypothetical protein BH11PLA2_BH11PLA2_38510 [soil metagenome]